MPSLTTTENPTPKRWKVRSEIIGIVEVLNAVLLTLAGYTIGQEEKVLAIVIGCLYAACKNFVERAKPINNYEDDPPKVKPDDTLAAGA